MPQMGRTPLAHGKHRLPYRCILQSFLTKGNVVASNLLYARRVRQEIKLTYNASTPEIQEEFGDYNDHVNWG